MALVQRLGLESALNENLQIQFISELIEERYELIWLGFKGRNEDCRGVCKQGKLYRIYVSLLPAHLSHIGRQATGQEA